VDLLQLHYFRAVAYAEHMTKAAKELHIAQPSLSMMISRLEEDVGTPLFDRHGRSIKLNDYGKLFLRYVEQSLTALEQGERLLKEMSGLERGSISLVTYSVLRFKDLLGSFFAQHPHVNFRVSQDGVLEKRVQLLEQGKADFYLAYPPLDQPGIQGIELWTDEMMLAVPREHRLAGREGIHLSEARDEPFIGLKTGTSANILQEGFCRAAGFVPKIVCEVDEPAAVAPLVGIGLGIAFVPPPTSETADPSVSYVRIDEPKCLRPLQLAWLESRELSQAAVAFRSHATAYGAFKRARARPEPR
jgi:DNA-binding transcriptional LysR family regulator